MHHCVDDVLIVFSNDIIIHEFCIQLCAPFNPLLEFNLLVYWTYFKTQQFIVRNINSSVKWFVCFNERFCLDFNHSWFVNRSPNLLNRLCSNRLLWTKTNFLDLKNIVLWRYDASNTTQLSAHFSVSCCTLNLQIPYLIKYVAHCGDVIQIGDKKTFSTQTMERIAVTVWWVNHLFKL